MSHVTNVHVNSGNQSINQSIFVYYGMTKCRPNRQRMQYNDKNGHKTIKNITGTYKDNVVQMTLCIPESHLGSSYIQDMSFGSEVVITRFNRRREGVNTMTWISHFTKMLKKIIF